MTDNTKKWIWISTGAITLGVGGFFLFKAIRDKFFNGGFENNSRNQSPSSSGNISSSNPFASSNELKAFQKWVINVKGNKTILGGGGDSGFGDDGIWGSKSASAWAQYGSEYQSSGGVSSGSQTNTWGKDALALSELKDRLVYDHNQDVDWIGSTKIEWDVTNAYPTVFFQAYPGGLLVLEKKNTLFGGRYQKQTGTWEKTPSGNWKFTFGGKTYETPTGQQLINTLWGLMKDANYFSWADGSFVPFINEKSINNDWQKPLL